MDGDSFFVAVEVAKNPALRGLPVVTGADRGIVTAASYEAKALGIPRGMPIFRLKKQFPQVIIMPGDYESYAHYSQMMFDIVRRYADDVEEYSIDECFADLTGLDRPLKMSYRDIAAKIKKEIEDELDLSISVGVAPTKVLAKMASKWQKPHGFTIIDPVIDPVFFEHVLLSTPVEKLWGIGGQTSAKLKKMGIKTAQDLARRERTWVEEHFSKPYQTIWHELNGTSVLAVDPLPKTLFSSMQRTRTFYPVTSDRDFLFSQLSDNTEQACTKARHYGLVSKHISFFLKTSDFHYVSSAIELSSPTHAPEIILPLIRTALESLHHPRSMYRATGVVLRELVPIKTLGKDLFGLGEKAQKFEAVHDKIDLLERKYGERMVYLASTQGAAKHKKKHGGKELDDPGRQLLFL